MSPQSRSGGGGGMQWSGYDGWHRSGLRVAVAVAVGFGVFVGLAVAVGFGVFVGVLDAVALGVLVGVGVLVAVGRAVLVIVAVAVADAVLVIVGVSVADAVAVAVGVADGVLVAVPVAVVVTVAVADGVPVTVAVPEAVGDGVLDSVAVTVGTAPAPAPTITGRNVRPMTSAPAAAHSPANTSNTAPRLTPSCRMYPPRQITYRRATSAPSGLISTAASGSLLFQISLPNWQLNPPWPASSDIAQIRSDCPGPRTPLSRQSCGPFSERSVQPSSTTSTPPVF